MSLCCIKWLALYIEYMINDIDLKVYKQVKSIKQVIEAVKRIET